MVEVVEVVDKVSTIRHTTCSIGYDVSENIHNIRVLMDEMILRKRWM